MFRLSHGLALEGSWSVCRCYEQLTWHLSSSALKQAWRNKRLQLRMILTVQSPMWFYVNKYIFLLLPFSICWVCPPPPSISNVSMFFRVVFISACRLLLTEAGGIQASAECFSQGSELYLHLMYLPNSAELRSEEHCHPGAV